MRAGAFSGQYIAADSIVTSRKECISNHPRIFTGNQYFHLPMSILLWVGIHNHGCASCVFGTRNHHRICIVSIFPNHRGQTTFPGSFFHLKKNAPGSGVKAARVIARKEESPRPGAALECAGVFGICVWVVTKAPRAIQKVKPISRQTLFMRP